MGEGGFILRAEEAQPHTCGQMGGRGRGGSGLCPFLFAIWPRLLVCLTKLGGMALLQTGPSHGRRHKDRSQH